MKPTLKTNEDQACGGKKPYSKPELRRFGSLHEKTREVGIPLPGTDVVPYLPLFGDPS